MNLFVFVFLRGFYIFLWVELWVNLDNLGYLVDFVVLVRVGGE